MNKFKVGEKVKILPLPHPDDPDGRAPGTNEEMLRLVGQYGRVINDQGASKDWYTVSVKGRGTWNYREEWLEKRNPEEVTDLESVIAQVVAKIRGGK